jgi:hypothetical protein
MLACDSINSANGMMVAMALQPLWDFDDVIEALGGPTAVGRLTGNPASGVCNWKRSHSRFPPKYYFLIKTALQDRGYYAPLDLFGFVGDFRKSA